MTIDERLVFLATNIESLHAAAHELFAATQEHTKQIADLRATAEEHTKQLVQDSEHIRAVVRIAEIHERRLSHLEGGEG